MLSFLTHGVYGIAEIFLPVVQVVFCHGVKDYFGGNVAWSRQAN